MIEIKEIESQRSIDQARAILDEYAKTLGFELTFQRFDRELNEFPGDYAPPKGRFFLAYSGETPIGCVAMREFDTGICEMKRLYVRPGFRGQKVGRMLAERRFRRPEKSGTG